MLKSKYNSFHIQIVLDTEDVSLLYLYLEWFPVTFQLPSSSPIFVHTPLWAFPFFARRWHSGNFLQFLQSCFSGGCRPILLVTIQYLSKFFIFSGLGVTMLAILTFKSIVISANSTQIFLSALLTIFEGIQGPSWQNCDFHGAHPKLCYKQWVLQFFNKFFFSNYIRCNDLWKNGSLSTHEFNKNCIGWVRGFTLIYNASKQAQWRFWRPPHLDYMSANVYKVCIYQMGKLVNICILI